MKYQFNKIFPLLIKKEETAGKLHFDTNLGLLDPNSVIWVKFFFDVSTLLTVTHCFQATILCNIKESY